MNCAICDAKSTSQLYVFYDRHIMVCNECGFQWLYPQPTDEQLMAIYNSDYVLGNIQNGDLEHIHRLKHKTASLYLDQLVKTLGWSDNNINKGNLLEIGCGTGDFLFEAKYRGFNVAGLDVNEHLVKLANRRLNVQCVLNGNIDHSSLSLNSFDIIVFNDVIEHVRDVNEFINRIHDLLKPDGKIFLVTPSLDSWSSKLMNKYWIEYKMEHLFYFNEMSIRILLQKSGFSNIRFIKNYKVLSFDYIYKHFIRFPVQVLNPLITTVRAITPDFVANKHLKIVASGMALVADRN